MLKTFRGATEPAQPDLSSGPDPPPKLSGHYSRDWSEYVNVIGVISEPFARELR